MFLELTPTHELSPATLQEARAFLETQNTSHPFQYPEWSSLDCRSYSALLRDRGTVRFFAQCGTLHPLGSRVSRLKALTITRGPVCDDAELLHAALTQLVDQSQARGFLYLDISPDWIEDRAVELGQWLGAHNWVISGTNRLSLRVDLRPDPGAIQAGFRKAARYEIHRAERSATRVVPARNLALFDQFLDIYSELAVRKNFQPDQESHMRHVVQWLLREEDRGTLLLASYRGEVLGGVVVVRAGSRCWYVWGATKKGAAVNVGHLMQWEAMVWAKQHGCTEYDLGGYQESAASGPAFFKRGFSDTVVHFLAPHRYVLNRLWYSICTTVHRKLRSQ